MLAQRLAKRRQPPRPRSTHAPTLVDAASKTDDVDGLVNEQLLDLHAIVAERDERIAELEARPWARLDAYEDPLTFR